MNLSVFLDPLIIIPVVGLSMISLALIASTAQSLLFSQLLFFILGFILMVIFSAVDYRIWKKLNWYIYFVCIFLLLVTFLGPSVRGATRWIELGLFRFQSSEFVKPLMIIFLANFISDAQDNFVKKYIISFLLFLPAIILIFRQPDLGNVIVYIFIYLMILIISGLPWKYIFGGSLLLVILLPTFWNLLLDYQRLRLVSFLNPQLDPIGTGYNALQAIIAIGSGKFLGLGLGKGTQSNLLFLPEYHTDFVFASLGEELGFFGGTLALLFYLSLLIKTINIGLGATDKRGKYIAGGIFAQFFVQIFINIGMNVGILPITGITLPMLSYGGSSILSSFISLGIAISLLRSNKRINPLVIR